jgi:pyridoxal phosphate enzyme (YggS family)
MKRACERCGREAESVRLVGVTKTVAPERVREAAASGLTVFGENYIQEAGRKIEALSDLPLDWHFIGHLQSNKAKFALGWFSLIHSVDRIGLAKEIDRLALKAGRRMDILIQVNLGEEVTKSGAHTGELKTLFKEAVKLDAVRVLGLMALPPYWEDPERSRPFFRELRLLLSELRQVHPAPEEFSELSMGMSHDFEAAIEEGATLVRVGTALFGARS